MATFSTFPSYHPFFIIAFLRICVSSTNFSFLNFHFDVIFSTVLKKRLFDDFISNLNIKLSLPIMKIECNACNGAVVCINCFSTVSTCVVV